MFRSYSNLFSQGTKSLAKGSFFLGLFLIGFGMLVFVLRDLFALLAAAIFFLAGLSAIGYAFKLFIGARNIGKTAHGEPFRDNVQVHYSEKHFDL